MQKIMIPTILGRGIYSISEAARLARVTPQQLRAWFYGWPNRAQAINHSDYDVPGMPCRALSFLDLIDALVIAELRKERVPLQYLRRVRDALSRELGAGHPFCYQNLYTQGRHVFIEIADRHNDVHLKELVQNQYAFEDILRPFLKTVEYAKETLTATKWRPFTGVAVDPKLQFGKPIVEAVTVPTSILAAAYAANGKDSARVAEWYGIQAEHVDVAVRFEESWLGTAA